ncbi:MAG TPA: short-chain dehydrogenase/reductase [Solirubrobacteraceae bacterium]|jgi:NAD(P)-dependent dehydrogenase (short-subunit alcohol dehydrogenase family)|nr:short-chain dehydrogenase/reductase [Solirubrobacteraceae bacterium]
MARLSLSGKVALVTGGARGIGLATGHALITRGACVAIVDLDEGDAQRAAAQLHDSRALGLAGDVTDRGAMQRAVAATVERFGGLDVVVANAGIAPRGATFRAMATEAFDRVLDVNLNGVHRTVAAALPEIVRRRGHVVVVSSIYAFVNGSGTVPYAMSKAAVEQFGRALRVELARHGASASVAYFGFIDTEMVHRALDADPLGDAMLETIPPLLRKRLAPRAAGEAIVRGIERRQARIIRPRRWGVLSVLRGAVNPVLDKRMASDPAAQDIIGRLDSRGDEEQPTTV